jgi:peptidyl-prolyl cis-trans isomerase SurA
MTRMLTTVIFLLALICAGPIAMAQEAVIAIVNDHPVTDFDVSQRIKLLEFLGEKDPAKMARKAVANEIINDYVKIDEAKLGKINPTPKEVDDRLKAMAQNLKTDDAGFKAKLASAGLTATAVHQYAEAQMSFGRLLQAKYHEKVTVDPAEVDKKFAAVKADIAGKVAKIEQDPRRQAVKVISLQEVNFPVEAADPQLLQSRAIEAGQAAQKITSCDGVKQAITGIFNVQVGRKIEADSRKLPPPLKAQLDERGVGHAIGPVRYPKGIQLLVYCSSRMVTPPKLNVQYPTRQQIENLTLNEKYSAVEGKYVALLRKTAIIEYKDPSYAQ